MLHKLRLLIYLAKLSYVDNLEAICLENTDANYFTWHILKHRVFTKRENNMFSSNSTMSLLSKSLADAVKYSVKTFSQDVLSYSSLMQNLCINTMKTQRLFHTYLSLSHSRLYYLSLLAIAQVFILTFVLFWF